VRRCDPGWRWCTAGATGILLTITGGPDLTLAEMNEACSLIAEAADPEANIIFGSVIDAHAGDEVRITVIATGFNAHAHEHPQQSVGRGPARGREGQMALPMQSSAMAQAPTMMAHQPTSPWGQTSNPTSRGGYAVPPTPRPDPGETINLDEFYSSMADVPPAAMGAIPAAAHPNGPEWTPSERPERPAVRPQQPAAPVPPAARRPGAQMQSPRSPDELGVEESEFDKPTYLRRGLFAPE
jgi:hypothetical protein